MLNKTYKYTGGYIKHTNIQEVTKNFKYTGGYIKTYKYTGGYIKHQIYRIVLYNISILAINILLGFPSKFSLNEIREF